MRYFAERLHPYLSQQGIQGLTDYCHKTNHNLLFKLLLSIDERCFGYAKFASDWVAFESRLQDETIAQVCSDFFTYMGLKVLTNRVPEAFRKPTNPAILLGINHDAVIEPLIIASLLKRQDIRFVGMKVFQYLGKHISDLIFPVLPKKVAINYQGHNGRTLKSRLDIVLELYRMESLTLAEIERLNCTSLKGAAEHIENGGLLIIFPNGGRSIEHAWYPGVGKMTKHLPETLTAKVPIFPIRTSGICRKQLKKCVRLAAQGNPQHTSVRTRIFDPIHLPPETASMSPDEIVNYLRARTESRISTVSDGEQGGSVAKQVAVSRPILY